MSSMEQCWTIHHFLFPLCRTMQIALIVAVVATLLFAENASTSPVVGHVGVRLLLIALCMVSVPTLAVVISKVVSRRLDGDNTNRQHLHRWYGRLRKIHTAQWLLVTMAIAYVLEWPRIVRFNWHLDRAPLIDDLLILVPVVLPLILSWAAFYRVDRIGMIRGQSTEADIADPSSPQGVSLRNYLDLHVRHYLAIVLLPVLSLLAIHDLIAYVSVELMEGVGAVLVMIGSMMLLLGLFPILLRRIWRTRPLAEGTLRNRLIVMAQHSGLKLNDILVWETGSMVVNAAVTGFSRRFRYVFLSDGLLELLDEDQIVAVFGHELAHVRHRHLWLRAAAMLIPMSVGLFAIYALPGTIEWLDNFVRTTGLDASSLFGLPILAAMVIYILTFFGFYSRYLEHEADLSACRRMPPEIGVTALCSALERLAMVHGNRNTRTWQHASIARRIEFLESAAREPKLGLIFDRRVRLFGGLVIALSLSPLICLLLTSYLLG